MDMANLLWVMVGNNVEREGVTGLKFFLKHTHFTFITCWVITNTLLHQTLSIMDMVPNCRFLTLPLRY